MIKKLIIHIGLPKTGTTSLQQAVLDNKCALVDYSLKPKFDVDVLKRLSDCSAVFITNEEVIFGSLRPRLRSNGQFVTKNWKIRLHNYLTYITNTLPADSVEILYSTRDYSSFMISAFAQNFDSHYWLDGTSLYDYKTILNIKSEGIVDVLRGKTEQFDLLIGAYGTPIKLDSTEIPEYLRSYGINVDTSNSNRMNVRSIKRRGRNAWVSKPITLGQFIVKMSRTYLNLPEYVFSLIDKIFRMFPFRNITVGKFYILQDNTTEFVFQIRYSSGINDNQPIGLISDRIS